MKSMWLKNILQRPWLVLLIGILFIAAAGYGAKDLYFRGDYKVYFQPDNPQLLDFEQMQEEFSKNENASIIVAPPEGEVFNPQTLKLIYELTDAAWQTPYSTRVDSLANFQHTWAQEDDLIVEDLILEPDALSSEEIARIKSVALNEPNLVNKIIATDGQASMINITVHMPEENKTAVVKEVADHVRALTEQYKADYPEHKFYHTGIVFMNEAFAVEAQKDVETLVPFMFLAIILVLWFLLRSFTGTLATLLVIVTTIVATMGLTGWSGIFLSTATVNAPTLIMTLAVADCVHVISSMLFALRQGKDKAQALHYAMDINLMPIFITSATTAIGFLTMNFSNVPILADLGNVSALGVMLAFVFSVTLLPALLMILPMRVARQQKTKGKGIEAFGEWVIRHHKRLLPVTFVIAILAVAASFNNSVNDIATEYFDDSTAFRQSTDFQEQHLSGMSTVDFAIYAGEPSALNDPQVLQAVEDFSQWLRQQPEVDHVNTISDTFKRLNKNMHGDDQSYYRLPGSQELAAQYLLLYEMSLPYGLDLNNQVNLDKSATRVMATMKNLGSKEFTDFEKRATDWMAERAPELTVKAASPSLMFAHIGELNMDSMLKGTLLALVLISGLLVFALRSWRMGLISLIPNLLPAGIGFGIWGLLSGNINLGLSVVLSMALGIIVDDTVHFLSKYRHARGQGQSAEQGVRFAFASVGRALWVTTLVLVIGFSVLSLSSFALNADMGLLTGIIILMALAVDFLFLPAFLMVFDKQQTAKEQRDDSHTLHQTN
ncbi:efflux RND transporter permease subunit [Lacimicrobium alkaliphilum]|uniref:RND transporter n=1 Tax=Lacimicrobium alkaliphilum TaxID=1526571 RepID=A0A0U3AL10_9ALTE|nr:MMPL family transporter [Lacimicrobium alkaliphilum]ALS99457.1 RND transporter [Lacimicrobium alkaliphilum]